MNDYLAKGPSMLNKLLGVLLRFRKGRHAFIEDISKMFHSIDIPINEQMTHLFLWRNLRDDCHPITYAMTAVNMGDRPSATIAQVALRKSAEESAAEFPLASKTIIESSYMDDIPASTDSKEQSLQLTHDIEAILEPRAFHIKEWIHSGSTSVSAIPIKVDSEEQKIMGDEVETVLGVQWEPGNDTLA